MDTAYLGPESSEEEIHALLDWKKKDIAFAGCVVSYIVAEEDLIKQTAQAIADGKVIGWFRPDGVGTTRARESFHLATPRRPT